MPTKIKETDIQRTICDYLALKKHFFWRSNNLPVFDTKRGAFRAMPKYSMRGIPDIIVIKDGWFVGLECKVPKGRLSEGQKKFQALCKEHGAEYWKVTCVEDVQELGL